MPGALRVFALCLLVAGCAEREGAKGRTAAPKASASSIAAGAAMGERAGPFVGTGIPCGELGCLAFPDAEAAFDVVLRSEARVLAVGETHAQKGAPNVPSATRRFREQLLPRLRGRTRHLVLELWVADGTCGAVERQVERQQKVATGEQKESNQNEFLLLARRARELGVEPSTLRIGCDEYRAIQNAGEADIDRMLQSIARATTRQVLALLNADADAGTRAGPQIVAYGGALHNDLMPRVGQEQWSFGPELSRAAGYLELDLIVPEFIRDTPSFRAFPWYSAYDLVRHGGKAVLFRPAAQSFVLVFPKTPPATSQEPP